MKGDSLYDATEKIILSMVASQTNKAALGEVVPPGRPLPAEVGYKEKPVTSDRNMIHVSKKLLASLEMETLIVGIKCVYKPVDTMSGREHSTAVQKQFRIRVRALG